jgi:hypothetical protein
LKYDNGLFTINYQLGTNSKDGGYKINAMDNFTEIYAKLFNITIPENSNLPDQVTGTWPAGAQGWYTALKPLPPGEHKVSYSMSVQGLGADNVASENTILST